MSATVAGRYSFSPAPPVRSMSAAETTASGSTSTVTGRMSHRGPPRKPAVISISPAKIAIAAIAGPPPSAASRPMPVAAPSEAASAIRASVARAIARAGSSRTWPPKAR